ncbi:OLC1v1018311C1 [Oldenlandia corymbosa var. corymbosa]|uniref:OLC1v1018311C1 n=1 Tax=Oldenlandia corymbosa var. corymbosa TaxID=529605 RepID=A0AAV1EBB6_OLDCO|nr:OLC1v1018311C1 [Oldenlandia corymbosa var. corymbosa]
MSTPVDFLDWSSILPELIWKISTHIRIHSDYIRFRAVCVAWRSSTPATPTHLPCQLPWLVLPRGTQHHHHHRFPDYHLSFLNLVNYKRHILRLPVAFHRHRRCRGSSHGWLVILEDSPSVFVFNPLTGTKLNLPPLSSFPHVSRFDYAQIGREYLLLLDDNLSVTFNLKQMREFVKKIVLSDSPSRDPDFTAVSILYGTGELVFCKAGQTQWTVIPGIRNFSEDVIFLNGLVYALNKNGSIAICDVDGDSPGVLRLVDATGANEGGDTHYLVAARGELLLVTRYFDLGNEYDTFETRKFRVCRLDSGGNKWERVMDLGDIALFVGGSSSLALSSTDFPAGCKGNRIYFTDDDDCVYEDHTGGGDHDLGIFSLEDGSIERLPCYARDSISRPVWITPNPC